MQPDMSAVSLALITQMLKLLDDDARDTGRPSYVHRMMAGLQDREGVVELSQYQEPPEVRAARQAALQFLLVVQSKG